MGGRGLREAGGEDGDGVGDLDEAGFDGGEADVVVAVFLVVISLGGVAGFGCCFLRRGFRPNA